MTADLFAPGPSALEAPQDAVEARGQAQAEREALVALALVPGVGPGRVRALLARFGSARAVLAAPAARLAAVDGVGRQTAAAIAHFDAGSDAEGPVREQFARAARVGAALVALGEDGYPAALAQIYDPPSFLWVRGRLDPADARAVAIVGTRKASAYGLRVAAYFAEGLAERGVTVVSGLAYGVDIAAHRAALAAGGRTLAVLGSGVDRIYPARHAPTVREIIEGDRGAVISEFPLGTAPDAPNFPRRNRIVAGLARGTLVAEARESGGALITAFMALEQNREVFAAPAPLFAEAGGTNRLVQKGGAALVTTVDDLLAELDGQMPTASPSSPTPPAPELNGPERRLYDALGPDPLGLDAVCAAAGLDASTALVYLLSLEFKGLVRQLAGKQFYRV